MLLNRIEKALMNNPARATLQRRFEARRLLAMGGRVSGASVLEVGCGRGVGTEIILDIFGARQVDAFDLDPKMVEMARRRLAVRREQVRLWTGDVTEIPAEDNSYDAVFDFAIIHHVPDWRDALREIHRVLKPKGRFYAEEVFEKFINQRIIRRLLEHPREDRFDHDRFVEALEESGFAVISTDQLLRRFGWFIADKRKKL
ncbi:MAG: class I SAM-dependent methyltransferase [Blastocatellia bacterium]|nr:class I SAM-dependent methyltransferase [Blastocatellia bacterium]